MWCRVLQLDACEGLRDARLEASQLVELTMAWCKGLHRLRLRAPSLQVCLIAACT